MLCLCVSKHCCIPGISTFFMKKWFTNYRKAYFLCESIEERFIVLWVSFHVLYLASHIAYLHNWIYLMSCTVNPNLHNNDIWKIYNISHLWKKNNLFVWCSLVLNPTWTEQQWKLHFSVHLISRFALHCNWSPKSNSLHCSIIIDIQYLSFSQNSHKNVPVEVVAYFLLKKNFCVQ